MLMDLVARMVEAKICAREIGGAAAGSSSDCDAIRGEIKKARGEVVRAGSRIFQCCQDAGDLPDDSITARRFFAG
jgi:hypothetical protein